MLRTIAVLALMCGLASSAFAQTEPAWNRRVSDIHIVHPPGTPPGTYRAQADLSLLVSSGTPMPASLAFDLTLSVNGVPFGLEPVDVSPLLAPNACQFQCPSTVCNQLSLTSLSSGSVIVANSFCFDPPGPTYACNCWLDGYWWWWQMDFVFNPSDTITATITARAGSLPEIDTSDDTFTVHVWERAPGVEYCFGDGTPTLCPCGNAGAPGNGCANSLNPAGANLVATGNGSVASDSVVLTGSGMPNSTCLYFQGTAQIAGGAGSAFGDGLRCAGGSVVRLGTKVNTAGTSQYPVGADLSITLKGAVPAGGGTRTYQVWYRNAAAFCTSSTFNLTNGVLVNWVP
jgi:hypothetical protein